LFREINVEGVRLRVVGQLHGLILRSGKAL